MSVEEHLERVYQARAPAQLSLAYDAWSQDYDRDLAGLGWHAPREAARLVAERVEPTARVLDIGAGTGLVGAELARLGFEDLTALDLSQQMLRRAMERGVYRRTVVGCLGETLALDSKSFDVTVGVGVFTEGHAGPDAFAELLRVTRGYIVFSLRPDLGRTLGFRDEFEKLAQNGLWRLELETQDLEGFSTVQTRPYRIWVFQVV